MKNIMINCQYSLYRIFTKRSMLIWNRIIIKKENKIIAYMYPNEIINPKHHVPKSINNNQTKNYGVCM
jgi:hypothetical protein